MSLPLLLQTKIDSIPNQIPYLSANPEKVRFWAERLGSKINKRVGLVWSGCGGVGSVGLFGHVLVVVGGLYRLI
jgi:hypothetical protein